MDSPHQIGPFEVLERLGAGGMGEVFKGRDTRLNRFVAIKFLPEAASAQARERFQREALAIAALNHPNICTVHESGEHGGRPYLVMELLEGETLRARLQRTGPLEAEALLDWGLQLADALEAAHRKGVLHRDLKPDNIWVSPGGHLKVLDFGLAQLRGEPADGEAPTLTSPLTSPGQTVGTYPYMSPEQARGEPVDARSDIFSFGSVFYEMGTGRRAFAAKTGAESLAAVLKDQPPPIHQVRPGLPRQIEDVANRCLEKDPELRYQSAADLRGELKRARRASSSAAVSAAAGPPRGGWDWRWPAIAVGLALTGALVWWALRPRAVSAPPQLSFRPLTFSGQIVDDAISPDGKFLATAVASPAGNSLHLLSIASGSDAEILPPASGCCSSISFSPDASQIYFVEGYLLHAIPVLGGEVRTIAGHVCGGAGFSPDGSHIAYLASVGGAGFMGLMLARADGSGTRLLHAPASGTGYTSLCWANHGSNPVHPPAWSPNGRWIALPESGATGEHVELVDAATGNAHELTPNVYPATDLSWLPDGSGLVFTEGTPPQLWEMTVPGGKLTQLTDDLQGYLGASMASTGQIALVHRNPSFSVWAQTRAGGAFEQLPGGGATQDGAAGLAWTPQNSVVSFRTLGRRRQLWIENPDGSGGHAIPIAGMPSFPASPVVAPNGQIVFAAGRIFRVNPDGTGLTPLSPLAPYHGASSPMLARGGRDVIYDRNGGKPIHPTLWAVPLAGGAAHEVWPGVVTFSGNTASPDGTRVLAITLTPGGGVTPMVIRLEGATAEATALTGAHALERRPYGWTPDGRAVTYVHQQGSTENVWALPVAGGKPYAITRFTDLDVAAYAFSRDGRLAVSRGSPNSDAVLATGLVKKP